VSYERATQLPTSADEKEDDFMARNYLDDGENSLADRRVVSNTWPGSGLFGIVAR
jgi:hypothetical protein